MSTRRFSALIGLLTALGLMATMGTTYAHRDNNASTRVHAYTPVGNTQADANAQTIYSYLRGYGLNHTDATALAAMFYHTTGADPTSVEGHFNNPYTMTDAKQHTVRDGLSDDQPNPGHAVRHAGIGIGGWTNEAHARLLDWAYNNNRTWYHMDTQLDYLVVGDDDARTSYLYQLTMNDHAHSTLRDATTSAYTQWMGLRDTDVTNQHYAATHYVNTVTSANPINNSVYTLGRAAYTRYHR